MKSRRWQAAYQAAVRASSPSTHEVASAIATQAAGAEGEPDGDLVELLRKECRAKEDDLITLEERCRVLRRRVAAWRRMHELARDNELHAHRRMQELEAQLLEARTTLAGSAYRTTLRELVNDWQSRSVCLQECIALLRDICDVLDAAEQKAAEGTP